MGKRVHANLHLGTARLDARRADGTGNAAACQATLLASNNLTASRKGVPSLPWPVCADTTNRPCPTMHPPISGPHTRIALACGQFEILQARCNVRTVCETTVIVRRLKAIRIRHLSLLRNTTRAICT